MISTLTGVISHIYDNTLIVHVAGVGFGVTVPDATRCVVGQKIELCTLLHWHQENGPTLFGFKDRAEQEVFSLIINCSGIGPKIALALLGALSVKGVAQAVCANDHKTLSQVHGVGAKKAESIILQLKDKLQRYLGYNAGSDQAGSASVLVQVAQTLKALNYSTHEINTAMNALHDQDKVAFDQAMRRALVVLAKK